MMTNDATAPVQPAPLLGLGSSDGLGPLPEPAHRERVYAGHGNEDVYEWYTAQQMREREAAVIAACAKRCEDMAARWSDARAVYVAHECARALRAERRVEGPPRQGRSRSNAELDACWRTLQLWRT